MTDFDSTELADIGTKHVGTGLGRGDGGLFAKGNSIAKGNPQAKHIANLRKTAREAGSPEQVKEAMDKFFRMFMDGDDLNAGIVWMQYTVGKPVQAVEVNDDGNGTTIIQVIRTTVGGSLNASD
jgi:hypothetical protein